MPLANIKKNIDVFVNNRLQDMPIHMKYKETEQHFFMDFHSHEGYEIYFFHEGEGCFLVEDHIFPLQGNDLILTAPHESHKCSPELGTPNTRTVIHFLPELLDASTRDWFLEVFYLNKNRRHLRLWDNDITQLFYPIDRIQQECAARSSDYLYAVRVFLNELLLKIRRLTDNGPATKQDQSAARKVNPKIEMAVKYLAAHYNENLSLEKIAKALYINAYYLSHLFKMTVGITITEFVLQTRIHHAKRFLLNTDMSMSEISETVGFNNSSYFGQAFKKLMGVSPRDFKKMHLQAQK